MRDGFKVLVNPPTRLGDVDLAATRLARLRLHEEVRLQQHVAFLMRLGADERVQIHPQPEIRRRRRRARVAGG